MPRPGAERRSAVGGHQQRTGWLVLAAAATTVLITSLGPVPPARAATACAAAATVATGETPWAQVRLAAQGAWYLARGKGELIAVVDTGVSADTPALAGAVAAGTDLGAAGGADDDCSGHGTFLAGLAAARPDENLPAGTGFSGVAPAARIYPVRVTDDHEQVDPDLLARGIRAAVDSGAGVVAVGVSTSTAPAALRSAVGYALAKDVVLIGSTDAPATVSGVSTQADSRSYPAALPGVLAVASITAQLVAGSDVGTDHPDVAAPGENLISIAPHGSGWVVGSGEGVAVGLVAGTAALVREYRPELSAAQVISRLEATADHPSTELPDDVLGYGVVDPMAAVSAELPSETNGHTELLAARPLVVPPARAPDRGPLLLSVLAAALALAAVGMVLLVGAMMRAGRRLRAQERA